MILQQTAIRKSKGIDEILSGYKTNPLEEESVPLKVTAHKSLQEALNQYALFFHSQRNDSYRFLAKDYASAASILTPSEITQFLPLTIAYEQMPDYVYMTALFLNQLIQKSYGTGHNDFLIDSSALTSPLGYLGSRLQTHITRPKPLTLTLKGEFGDYYAEKAVGCTFELDQAGKKCGLHARDCIFKTRNITLAKQIVEHIGDGSTVHLKNADGTTTIMMKIRAQR